MPVWEMSHKVDPVKTRLDKKTVKLATFMSEPEFLKIFAVVYKTKLRWEKLKVRQRAQIILSLLLINFSNEIFNLKGQMAMEFL